MIVNVPHIVQRIVNSRCVT